jgi:hypothetical protein
MYLLLEADLHIYQLHTCHFQVGPDHAELAASGVEPPAADGASSTPTQRCSSYAGLGWQARWFKQQRGLTRYNCADSLDRTNVGSFFGAVQVRCGGTFRRCMFGQLFVSVLGGAVLGRGHAAGLHTCKKRVFPHVGVDKVVRVLPVVLMRAVTVPCMCQLF